ncbi:MAG TPA: DUF4129 domain-containing protein [Candidatus Dormibacteraeota bacterium]|nr:DUF4129 domain-containing protein [Candidatus Dormibacteraeota bacterium]
MAHRGRSLRLFAIPALGLLLIGLAALVRAGGEAPALPSPGRIYEALAEAVAVFVIAVGVVMLGVTIWAFPRPIPGRSARSRRRSRWRLLVTVGLTYLVVGILFLQRGQLSGRSSRVAGGLAGTHALHSGPTPQLSLYDWAGFALGAAAVLALAVFVLWHLYGSRRTATGPAPDAAITEGAEAGLAELSSIRDPRTAVIRAYAAMEHVFSRRGLERRPHEAPNEYLARLISGSSGRRRAATALTGLYHVARFSPHPVSRDMKQEAIVAFDALKAPDE